jgi:hypothetical protein
MVAIPSNMFPPPKKGSKDDDHDTEPEIKVVNLSLVRRSLPHCVANSASHEEETEKAEE